MIQYLKHDEIDKTKWDENIDNARIPLIYAKSWYLDAVSPNWEALVSSDYSYLMPLPVKRKFGMSYVVQPILCKQLGIFSSMDISREILDEFIAKAIEEYKYIRLSFNFKNIHLNKEQYQIIEHKNHLLNLNVPYNIIKESYKRRAFQNISRAQKGKLKSSEYRKKNDFLMFIRHNVNYLSKNDFNSHMNILPKLIDNVIKNSNAEFYTIVNANNNTVAVGLFFIDKERIYFVFNASNEEGIKHQSMYLLTDYVIQKYSGKNFVLDFTGSSMKNIAYFIESFGAQPEVFPYLEVKKMKFPFRYMI